jgi:uncharacterized protein (TIGR00297 family)
MEKLFPTQDWWLTLSAFLILGFFLLLAEITRKYFHWSGEVTRKLTHIGTGLLVFFSPLFLSSKVPPVTLGLFFAALDFMAIQFHWLKGIHGTTRKTYGTVYYPLAFAALTFLCWDVDKPALMLAMAVLALGDAAAGMVGENLKNPVRYNLLGDEKSVEGSVVMFVISFLVILAGFYYLSLIDFFDGSLKLLLSTALVAATVATVAEGVSIRGSDNMTIPLSVAFVVHMMISGKESLSEQILIGMLLSLAVAVISWRIHFLSASGAAGAFILGVVIFGLGGWLWAVPIITFYVTSSIISKLGKTRKEQFDLVFEKGSIRDIGQVLANGGIAGAVVIVSHFYPNEMAFPFYIGAVAAAAGDTWATEIGVFFQRTARNIANFRKVATGTSGGVSWPGVIGAASGSAVVAVSVLLADRTSSADNSLTLFSGIVLAGIIGSLMDSFWGATVQSQYHCRVCGKVTEKQMHCENKSNLVRGFEFFSNDLVNFMGGLAGGLVMVGFMMFAKTVLR